MPPVAMTAPAMMSGRVPTRGTRLEPPIEPTTTMAAIRLGAWPVPQARLG
jgi:hypothetical protein